MYGIANNFWLIVEDSDDDFLLFRRACSRALNPEPMILRVKDGAAAQTILRSMKPRLIVSDLNMPGLTGLELLKWVRRQDELQFLRFVMLTSSSLEQDIKSAERLGVDDYRVKPTD